MLPYFVAWRSRQALVYNCARGLDLFCNLYAGAIYQFCLHLLISFVSYCRRKPKVKMQWVFPVTCLLQLNSATLTFSVFELSLPRPVSPQFYKFFFFFFCKPGKCARVESVRRPWPRTWLALFKYAVQNTGQILLTSTLIKEYVWCSQQFDMCSSGQVALWRNCGDWPSQGENKWLQSVSDGNFFINMYDA